MRTPQLEAAFRATRYEVTLPDGGPLVLRIDEPSPALADLHAALGVRSSGLISAWNPRSGRRAVADNELASARLAARLLTAGFRTLPTRHVAAQREWDERGWFVPDIALDTLLAIGREFDQHALLHAGVEAVPRLAWCYGGAADGN